MPGDVASHYTGQGGLTGRIAESLKRAGKDLTALTTRDLAPIDEFHVRGRPATIELAQQMALVPSSNVLDIGSGLGGPARTVAETYGCRVTGIDLTPEFCEAAKSLSDWVGLGEQVRFLQGDATSLPFEKGAFDAAMTIHVAMNIAAKNEVYTEAKRALRSGGVFAVYDICQGEGGEVLFPVPWARTPEISHLATPSEMQALLKGAGFKIIYEKDSTEESQAWFEAMAERISQNGPPVLTFREFLGEDFPQMTQNQVRNLTERRIRTCTFICEA
jgi:ubiquinone/menaquinone biosynthesis C-methylase UbiE